MGNYIVGLIMILAFIILKYIESGIENEANEDEKINDLEKAIASQKSYIGASAVVFLLYWFFYFPGLIVNIMYINDAEKTKKISKETPSGYGCLYFLLVIGLLPLLMYIIILI